MEYYLRVVSNFLAFNISLLSRLVTGDFADRWTSHSNFHTRDAGLVLDWVVLLADFTTR